MKNVISIIRNIDKYIGNLIIATLLSFRRAKRKVSYSAISNILIIRLWTLGESLLTLPMIKKLKENGYNISVLVTKRSKEVFEKL